MMKAIVNKEIMYATKANSGMIGECPHCGKPVRAKCGEINVEHWSHINSECSYITERDTEWHIAWKNKFENKGYETEKRFGNFIADSFDSKTNTVIEFQHSQMASQKIRDRCNYYKNTNKNIKWIFDYTDKFKNDDITIKLKNKGDNFYYTFEVKWQKKEYIRGTCDGKYPIIPIYFNTIYNHDINDSVPLSVINCTENTDIKTVYVENIPLQIESEKYLSVNYDKNKVMLLKVNTIYDDGKYGSCELIFI